MFRFRSIVIVAALACLLFSGLALAAEKPADEKKQTKAHFCPANLEVIAA